MAAMWTIFYKLASPKYFYGYARRLAWVFGLAALLLLGYGLVAGLAFAPADYQQGNGFRIIYIHVPSAFLSLSVYVFLAVSAVLHLVWRMKLPAICLQAAAPIGAMFTFLALVTGSLWGKPMWGTYWLWDARLTSELILLFLYFAVIALQRAFPQQEHGDKAASVFALIGAVNIPIIHYSVYWWNTLHQGATVARLGKPAIAGPMLYPLLAMIFAFICYFAWKSVV